MMTTAHFSTKDRILGAAEELFAHAGAEKYDAAAFDPEYDTLPLSFFEPMMPVSELVAMMQALDALHKQLKPADS